MRYIFLPFLMCFSTYTFLQGEAKTLYFGNLGIDFRTDPITFLTNSSMEAIESAATICDANGDLLFYTNGGESPGMPQLIGGVWNRNHSMMTNGILDDSSGCTSSFHGSIIIPVPSGTKTAGTEYYIFNRDCIESSAFSPNYNAGLTYTKVDMSLSAGLGAVVEKNVPVVPFQTTNWLTNREPLAAVKQGNNVGYWLFSYAQDSLYSLEITSTGIQGFRTYFPEEGKINFAPSGDFVFVGSRLYSFDDITGDLSQLHDFGFSDQAFSPDGTKMYLAESSGLVQYDLLSNNIPNSGVTLLAGNPVGGRKVILAPNSKVYYWNSATNTQFSGSIDCPNNLGLDCGLNPIAVPLPSGYDLSGNFTNVVANFLFNSNQNCVLGEAELNLDARVKCYPNPGREKIVIEIFQEGNYQVILCDSRGKILMEEIIFGKKKHLDVKNIPDGLYTIQILSDKFVATKKIVIQN